MTRKKISKDENSYENRTKLKDIHYEFMLEQGTLDMQVSKSLEERAADFMRVFSSKKMSAIRLWAIYKKNKVRKKKVRITKILTSR